MSFLFTGLVKLLQQVISGQSSKQIHQRDKRLSATAEMHVKFATVQVTASSSKPQLDQASVYIALMHLVLSHCWHGRDQAICLAATSLLCTAQWRCRSAMTAY